MPRVPWQALMESMQLPPEDSSTLAALRMQFEKNVFEAKLKEKDMLLKQKELEAQLKQKELETQLKQKELETQVSSVQAATGQSSKGHEVKADALDPPKPWPTEILSLAFCLKSTRVLVGGGRFYDARRARPRDGLLT